MLHPLAAPRNHYVWGAVFTGCIGAVLRRSIKKDHPLLGSLFADTLSFPLPFEFFLRCEKKCARYYETHHLKYSRCPVQSSRKTQKIIFVLFSIWCYIQLNVLISHSTERAKMFYATHQKNVSVIENRGEK